MTEKISPAKSALIYGIFFGLIMVLEFVTFYVMDIDPIENSMVGVVMNICNYLFFPVIFIFLAAQNFKNTINNGFISISETIKIGVVICIIAAIIFGVFNLIFNLIFPEYMSEVLGKVKSVMIKQNPDLTAEQLEMGISMTKKFMNPWITLPIAIAVYSFIGLLYSAIIGAIIKKDSVS